MLVSIGQTVVPAVFDSTNDNGRITSAMLSDIMPAVRDITASSIALLVTCVLGDQVFNTLVDFDIEHADLPSCALGIRWFGCFVEHVRTLGMEPPKADNFDIAHCLTLPKKGSIQSLSACFAFERSGHAFISDASSSRNHKTIHDIVALLLPAESVHDIFVPRHVDTLHRVMTEHGLRVSHVVSDDCERLNHHLLFGLCSCSDAVACRPFAGTMSRHEMSAGVLSVLWQRAQTTDVAVSTLERLTRSLGCEPSSKKKRAYVEQLKCYAENLTGLAESIPCYLEAGTILSRKQALYVAASHGIAAAGSVDIIVEEVFQHTFSGKCLAFAGAPERHGCGMMQSAIQEQDPCSVIDTGAMQQYLLNKVSATISLKAARKLLQVHGIAFAADSSLSKLRRLLKQLGRSLAKGKALPLADPDNSEPNENGRDSEEFIPEWPNHISDERKRILAELFRSQTSSEALKQIVCACCSRMIHMSEASIYPVSSLNLEPLRKPESYDDSSFEADVDSGHPNYDSKEILTTMLYLDAHGVVESGAKRELALQLCNMCASALDNDSIPKFSLANKLHIGDAPKELRDLTPVEESIIALCRAKQWIVQLYENKGNGASMSGNHQLGMRGHTIVYPQNPSSVAKILPPTIEEIITPICVVFVGSKIPSRQWLMENAKPLIVRADRIRRALKWLKNNNPLYENIIIDENRLMTLEATDFLPFHVELVPLDDAQETLVGRYDNPAEHTSNPIVNTGDSNIVFENLVVANVDGLTSSMELRAAAVRHLVERGGDFVQIPHGDKPVNEFNNVSLFPEMYPTLFPYGIGGLDDATRRPEVSFQAHVKYLLTLRDSRFREHHSFMFSALNIIQRRAMLLKTSLKTKRSNFKNVAVRLNSISLGTMQEFTERVRRGESVNPRNDEEKQVLELMNQVSAITMHVPGSAASRLNMRSEIKALMIELGLPSFYITINPADVYNPVVKFLAGADIDVDALTADCVPQYREQAKLVADNPVVATTFFHTYMKAFIDCLLKYDSSGQDSCGGILGKVSGYYGCIEAQGRGTLHCHMLVWLSGALNPMQIRERVMQLNSEAFQQKLINFLDDVICNDVPPIPSPIPDVPSSHLHPCSVRGLNNSASDTAANQAMDLHNVVKSCQIHKHTATCYKYNKDSTNRTCRFGLDEQNFQAASFFDPDTGELTLRCLNGLVNNYNRTIIQTMRCNMDIKFIGSGPSAKAALYYITDYISKSQLKAHVSFAALESAMSKLGEYKPAEHEITVRAKSLLQKCAYSMIANQELSAQQVCSLLLGYEDKKTGHTYRKLYWRFFEKHLDEQRPLLSGTSQNSDAMLVDGCDVDTETSRPLHALDTLEGEDEDVVIVCDTDGNVKERTSFVEDYTKRGVPLTNISLWDFVAQVDKVKGLPATKSFSSYADSLPRVSSVLLNEQSQSRPVFALREDHIDSDLWHHKIRHPVHRFVVVPAGAPLLRRDVLCQIERYHRLMLLLFCPWRHASDLVSVHESWSQAFFRHSSAGGWLARPEVEKMMDNIQILHECKDSRDHHAANRRASGKTLHIAHEMDNDQYIEDFVSCEEDEQDALLHIQHLQNMFSDTVAQKSSDIEDCLAAAQKGGLLGNSLINGNTDIVTTADEAVNIGNDKDGIDLESLWKAEYIARRQALQDTLKRNDSSLPDSRPVETAAVRSLNTCVAEPTVATVASARQNNEDYNLPQHIINKWTLTTEQAFALRLVAQQVSTPPSARATATLNPLRMFLNGPAGTGKSRVISALRDFFDQRGETRRLRICSFMGIAARNVSGMTLHSALKLGSRSKGSNRDLMDLWEGVDFLFIDEVSMVSCRLLCQISRALSIAKGHPGSFGNINIIFAGDFAQLAPVGDAGLHATIDTAKYGKTSSGQDVIFGKLLWLSVKTVVTLKTLHRQAGTENARFINLLGRMRKGGCHSADFDLLNTRLLEHDNLKNDPAWRSAPIIVYTNAAKDALNAELTEQYAKDNNLPLHWYYSLDKLASARNKSAPVQANALKSHLWNLDSGRTNHRLGKIPLVLGMPVMISHNFDVAGGIVNGSRGVLKGIRFVEDDEGHRYLKSCVVEVLDSDASPMPMLDNHVYPVLPDTVSFQLKNPFTHDVKTVHRTQVPLVPAFAMTAHRAQGQTMKRAIIDLASCKGAEAPYVMLSRVSSLEGLAILRPFDLKKIRVCRSQDHRIEQHRLLLVELLTLQTHGDLVQQQLATNELKKHDNVATQALYTGSLDSPATLFSALEETQASLNKVFMQAQTRPRLQRKYDEIDCLTPLAERPEKRVKL